MPQATDIVINGAGYMVEPGSYKRLQDGMAEGRTERIALTDFFGGQHRALQLERDTFHDSLGIGPALGGQGVAPWGNVWDTTIAALVTTFPDRDLAIPNVIVRDRLWIAIGPRLYQGAITTPDTGWAWTLRKTFPQPIVDMCIYNSKGLLVTFGSAADITYFDCLTFTETVLFAGERGTYIAAYSGYAGWSDAKTTGRPTIIRLVTGAAFDQRTIDHDPIALTTIGAEMVVVTKQALYSYTGRVKTVTAPGGTGTTQEWSGEFNPYFQQGVFTEQDDYRLFVSYGGRTIAWIGGGVHELVPSGDRAGWRSTGLEGKRCFGGCVAAGYVVVSIESYQATNEVWAYDGSGWWRLLSQPMPAYGATGTWCWPMSIGQGGVLRNVVVFREGTNATTVLRLAHATTTSNVEQPAVPPISEFVSPMIDAGERDKPKAWRKVGAVFASPVTFGSPGSSDAVALYLDYSIDGGVTWTTVASDTKTGNTVANMNFELEAALSGQVSKFLMIRVRWLSVSAWAPILVGVWAEYEVLHNPARRRRWEFKVHARDQEIDRNGVLLTRTGRQLISELWTAWQNDSAETFRDLDYDADPTERTVRIVGIQEAVAQPADSNEWGDSIMTLKLVEV